MKVRERLITLLTAYGISYQDVANTLGIRRETFGKKLKGDALFDEKEMRTIKEFYFPDENLEKLFEIKEI